MCGVNGFGKVNRGLICTDSSTSEGGSCWLHHLKNDCSFHEAESLSCLLLLSSVANVIDECLQFIVCEYIYFCVSVFCMQQFHINMALYCKC